MNITGTVKIIDFPEEACLTTVKDLLMDLEKYLAVELPVEQITNVFVSATEPETTDRDVIWFRVNNAGNFIGQFVYAQGAWIQMFPHPNGIFRMYGDSRDIPAGFLLIDEDTPGFTTAMANAVRGAWVVDPPGSDYYAVFDVVYVGL